MSCHSVRPLVRQFRHVLTVLFLLHFLVLLPIVCYALPYSLFLHVSEKYLYNLASNLNTERLKEAKQYFADRMNTNTLEYYNEIVQNKSVYLAVAIVTINRRHGESGELGYLLQSASGLDKFAKSQPFRKNTFVFVCNVDLAAREHSEAEFIRPYLPHAERYGGISFHVPKLHLPNSTLAYDQLIHSQYRVYEKETYDYMYCMKVARAVNPKYVLMVEDDAVPHKDLATVLKHTLQYRLGASDIHTGRQKQFGFLKLYYPQKWQGYATEATRLLELVSVGCVGGGLALVVLWISNLSTCTRRSYQLKEYWGTFVLGVLFAVLTAECVGRQNVMELRRMSRYLYLFGAAAGCCTQAMLYPADIVDKLVNHLALVPSHLHTDLAVHDFVSRNNIPAYQLEPNLFYHVGMCTSLQLKQKPPEEFVFTI